ncbi:MAG TPA: hypothetical protein GXZ48_00325 [Acholeplasmataceae bacterium]|jgi:hypothetical protein|nr:hypothetical protein [Acholeplasmataceae bacterium]
MKNNKSLTSFKILLVFLITSLSITGISFLDNAIWNLIMAIVGVIAYAIVAILYSIHAISGSKAGRQAYAAVFIILLFIGYSIYQGIVKFQKWIISWPLYIKICVLAILIILIILMIIFLIKENREETKDV